MYGVYFEKYQYPKNYTWAKFLLNYSSFFGFNNLKNGWIKIFLNISVNYVECSFCSFNTSTAK